MLLLANVPSSAERRDSFFFQATPRVCFQRIKFDCTILTPLPNFNTPYSKMPKNLLFFYSYVNWPSMPRSHLENSKEFLAGIEALWAN